MITRGSFAVGGSPRRAFWKGLPLDLTPRQVAILALLVERGEATHFALDMVGVGPNTSGNSMAVQICHLRKKLRGRAEITSVRGSGYALTMIGDGEVAA